MPQPWIQRAQDAPYFVDETGRAWTPIGQNDSVTWSDFSGLIDRRDLPDVARHFGWMASQGVTCLRLMLEYAETGEHFFEQPAGTFNPRMIAIWDDLFALAEQAGLRILLTPLDTYFHWVRWDLHPFNAANGGPCGDRTELMIHPGVRALIKARLEFATRRWGGSGTLFAWDLWNEMHPVQGQDRPDCFHDYISDVGPFLRKLEQEVHGRAHLQCVSVFGPELRWKPWLNEPIFRHPDLDFASSHFYAEGTIDDPQDTVAPALAVAELVGEALAEITDGRPFLDTEHGPIHTFKDHRITLTEAFDDEYFRRIQWTHMACGGAGGGMRWPNRHPHRLTVGMRRAQRILADFADLVAWERFARRPLADLLWSSDPTVATFGCGDGSQAIIYALRQQPLTAHGCLDPDFQEDLILNVSGMGPGRFEIWWWNTICGGMVRQEVVESRSSLLSVEVAKFGAEGAFIVRRQPRLMFNEASVKLKSTDVSAPNGPPTAPAS